MSAKTKGEAKPKAKTRSSSVPNQKGATKSPIDHPRSSVVTSENTTKPRLRTETSSLQTQEDKKIRKKIKNENIDTPQLADEGTDAAIGGPLAASSVGPPPESDEETTVKDAEIYSTKNFVDAYNRIQEVVKTTATTWTTSFNVQKKFCNFINRYANRSAHGKEVAALWGNKVTKYGTVPLLANFIDALLADKAVINGPKKFDMILAPIWNLTDASPLFCAALCQAPSLLAVFLQALANENLVPTTTFGEFFSNDSAIMNILFNCAWHQRALTIPIFRENNGIEMANKILRTTESEESKFLCSLMIAYSINEEETAKLENLKDLLGTIKNRLQRALDAADHSYDGFRPEEILHGANALIERIDYIKKQASEMGFVELYAKALHTALDDDEVSNAVQGLWAFSFHPDIKPKMIQMKGLLTSITKLQDHEDATIKKAATGFVWNITGKTTNEVYSKTDVAAINGTKNPGHVMISYSWAYQNVAKQINDSLKRAGYVTWMDVERMSGSILEAMASAVEEASCIVVCFSEPYKSSPACRQEAEYANKKRKPIVPVLVQDNYDADGWLGIFLGNRLYVKCASAGEIDGAWPKILAQLQQVLESPTMPVTKGAVPLQQRPLTPIASVKMWTEKDVQNWLAAHGLNGLCEKLNWVNGKMLLSFKSVHDKQPGVYYENFRKNLHLDEFKDAAQLASLFDELK